MPLSLEKDKNVGAAGTAVPIIGSTGCEAGLVLPAAVSACGGESMGSLWQGIGRKAPPPTIVG